MERDELASLVELIQDDALAILENQAVLSEVSAVRKIDVRRTGLDQNN